MENVSQVDVRVIIVLANSVTNKVLPGELIVEGGTVVYSSFTQSIGIFRMEQQT